MTAIARLIGSFALAVACGLPSALHAADDTSRIAAAIDRAVQPIIKRHDVPGLAVGVSADGKPHLFYYGVASKETGANVDAGTLFEIGSISKMFTATLAAFAQGEGKLWLADHPSRFMPELRGSAIDQATILNLGTYTAGGLPLHFPNTVKTNEEMIAFLRNWKASGAPGVERRYSNPSAGLLGHMTALAMGGGFSDLMEGELLPSLGVTQCFLRIPQGQMQNYAWGYRDTRAVRMGKAVFDVEAYGFKCSAAGLLQFVEANMSPERLAPPIRRAVEQTQVGYFRVGGMVQGFGWEQYPYPVALKRLVAGNSTDMSMKPNAAIAIDPALRPSTPTLFNKTGSTGGFSAYVAFVPAKNIGIVLLANKALPAAPRVTAALAILDALQSH